MNRTKFTLAALAAALLFPVAVSAHAIPVASSPQSSSAIEKTPQTVSIRFSERPDEGASSISIKGPKGDTASAGEAKIDPVGPTTLAIPLKDEGDGTYIVSWSVVSADDGHFTKGAFEFTVGSAMAGMAPGAMQSAAMNDVEVVELATKPEVFSMTLELFGNGIIWAALILFSFGIRPLLARFADERKRIEYGYLYFMLLGTSFAIIGGIIQLLVKSTDLASVREMAFVTALPLYLKTVAGNATLFRVLAVFGVLSTFSLGWKSIIASKKITIWEIGIGTLMCVFAFFRAIISHATANPFHPHISIAVNFLHLIEKDIWAGITLALFLMALMPRLRGFLGALIPRAFAMLALDFAAVSVTATYIVWLHLKSFDNLFTTQWGAALMDLLLVAVFLVAIRVYHVMSSRWKPALLSRYFTLTIGAEFAFALLVVYASSVVIITSPPVSPPHTMHFSGSDHGISMSLDRDVEEDGMLMLAESSGGTPTVTIEDTSDTQGPITVDLLRRSATQFVFPSALLVGQGPFTVSIFVPHPGALDASVSFTVPKGALTPIPGSEKVRDFDRFTLVMCLIAFLSFAFAVVLYQLGAKANVPISRTVRTMDIAGFLIAIFVGANAIAYADSTNLWNPFRAECERDGNMWHIMLPMKGGIPTSQLTQEGCMWGMGAYTYMFPNRAEYEYALSLPHANVTTSLQNDRPMAGIQTHFSVKITEPDASPATLFYDMEKLMHVVIVSEDETVFAHIHGDDTRSLTKEEIDSSTQNFVYTFPKAGRYLVSVDYAHGMALESQQFIISVRGAGVQSGPQVYQSPGEYDGYSVSLAYDSAYAGEVTTLRYTIAKDDRPVTNLEPYLSAAMHISVVKNDFSKFIHIHGEVHPQGQPLPPIHIKNGQVVHTMAMMMTPDTFGPNVEAHLIFPSKGLYTVWGEFKVGGKVIPTAFTVRVE